MANPLQKEFAAFRINQELDITRHIFERDFNKAYRPSGGTNYFPGQTPSDALIGSEHTAEGATVCRYLAFRLGRDLFDVLVDAVILDMPMAGLASGFAGQSQASATSDGRARISTALTLADAVYEDWRDLVDGTCPRFAYALGPMSTAFTTATINAANDNARRVGNRVQTATSLRAWRYREPAIAKALFRGDHPEPKIARDRLDGLQRREAAAG